MSFRKIFWLLALGLLLPLGNLRANVWSIPGDLVTGEGMVTISWWGFVSGTNGPVYIQIKQASASAWDTGGECPLNDSWITVEGSFPLTAAGTYGVRIVRGTDNAEIASATFEVAPNTTPTTFAFGNLSHTFDGQTKTATVTPNPAAATYTASLSAGPAVGIYTVSATATAPYTGSGLATLTIAKASQSITFANPTTQLIGRAFTLNATATSGLPVTFTIVSGSASLSGSVLTPLSAADVTVRAAQAGNGNYLAASNVDLTFSFVATLDTTAPSIPAGLSATAVGADSFTLSWSPATDNVGVTGYEVYMNGALLGTTAATSYAVSGIPPGATCSMTVKAHDAAGNPSLASTALLVTTLDLVAPSIPAGLVATSTDPSIIRLQWQASTDNSSGPLTYEIQDASTGTILGTTTATEWIHSGLPANSICLYRVRARDGAGNLSAFTADVLGATARLALGLDSDGDGMADSWETAHGLNPNNAADASLDPDGDQCSNLEEFKMGSDPRVYNYSAANMPAGAYDSNVDLVVRARGTGTVTLYVEDACVPGMDRTIVLRFAGAADQWITNGPLTICINKEKDYRIRVLGSTVPDFYVGARPTSNSLMLLRQMECTINGLYVDQISKAEAGASFVVRAGVKRKLAFGACDLSELERMRPIVLGMGCDFRGRSGGMIRLTPAVAGGEFTSYAMGSGLEPGPGALGVVRHAARQQVLVADGLVDLQHEVGRTVVRFFAGTQFSKSGDYYTLPSEAPSIYYQLDLLSNTGPSIYQLTRMVNGELSVMRLEYSTADILLNWFEETDGAGLMRVEDHNLTSSISCWDWRRPGAPLPGLLRYDYSALQQRLHHTIGGDSSSVCNISVRKTVYGGASSTQSILYQELANYGDYELLGNKTRLLCGRTADAYYEWKGVGGDGSPDPTTGIRYSGTRLNTGGGVRTEYYSLGLSMFAPGNLGSAPVGAAGKPKEKRVSFGDDTGVGSGTPNPTTLVTSYGYVDALGGAKTLVQSAKTVQGTTTLGQQTYSYALGSLNGKETEIAIEVASASASQTLTTRTVSYSARIADEDFRDRRVSVTKPDGSKVAYAYQRGTLTGSTWVASATGAHFLIAELTGKTGAGVDSYRGVAVDSLDMDPGKSLLNERILDVTGKVLSDSSYVYQTGGTFALIASTYYQYDALGNLLKKADQPIASNGTTAGRILYEATYLGFKKRTERDETGILACLAYDDYGRVATVTRASAGSVANGDYVPARTTSYTYDWAGHVLTESIGDGETSKVLITSYTYDTAGRLKTRTLPGGFTTQTTYELTAPQSEWAWGPDGTYTNNMSNMTAPAPESCTKVTVTNPDGSAVTTEYFKDGRVKAITGTAVADSSSTYSFDASGNLTTTTTLTGTTPGASTKVVTDWLGRTIAKTSSAWAGATRTETPTYNSLGQLTAQTVTSGTTLLAPTRRFAYDTYGRLVREGSDTNNNSAIDLGSDADVKDYEFGYQQTSFNRLDTGGSTGTAWYRYEGVKIYPYEGTNATTGRYFSQTYTQLSGLSDAWAAHSFGYDFDRNATESFAAIDRAACQQTVTTLTTGTNQAVVHRSISGLVIESTDAQGHTTDLAYDGLGRLIGSSDPRIGLTSTAYVDVAGTNQTTLLNASVTTPDGKTTSFGYDSAGRQVRVTAPDGKISHCQYDAMGNLTYAWGDTVNPVRYVYSEIGQRTEMYTYRTGSWTGNTLPTGFASGGDKTTWVYDGASGLLQTKTDADNRSTGYTYDAAGRLLTRTDARGVVTSYGYFDVTYASTGKFTGLQRSVSYALASGVAATPSLAYTYHRTGKIKTVTDAAGTRTFNYFETWSGEADLQGHSGRLASEVLPTSFFGSRSLTYGYQYAVAGRRNGEAASVQYGTASDYRVTYAYDATLRLSQVASSAAALPFDYTYTAGSNLVESVAQWAGLATNYCRTYDYEATANRLENLQHTWGANAVESRFQYNTVGLRSSEATGGAALMTALGRSTGLYSDYTYTARREVDTAGQADLTAAWGKGTAVTGAARDYDYDPIGNRTTDQSGSYTANASNQYSAAPGAAALGYDLAGNLTSDGTRTYTYDAENRLASVVQGGVTSSFKYDYLGRRISKTVGSTETRFVYDGWNLIAELNGLTRAIQRTYTWGLDASGSLQGAGGVGGLLCIASGTQRYYPIYDGSFNVIGLYDGTGAIAAAYRYDPFGNLLQSAGTAATLPFGFSTKYTDRETGLIYYGLRYYHAPLGRFINRDPIEEKGGLNLYAFCGNDGVNKWDHLGMDDSYIDSNGDQQRWVSNDDPGTGGKWVNDGNGGGGSDAAAEAELRGRMEVSFERSQMEESMQADPGSENVLNTNVTLPGGGMPEGYEPSWPGGKDNRGPYVQNPQTGTKWYPHAEDSGHWPHWDEEGNKSRYPEKSLKPRPGQKRPPYGDQAPQNPWPQPPPVPQPSPSPQAAPLITPQEAAGAVVVVGTGYFIYRGVRMLPSLLPPLWWTIPANALTP